MELPFNGDHIVFVYPRGGEKKAPGGSGLGAADKNLESAVLPSPEISGKRCQLDKYMSMCDGLTLELSQETRVRMH